MKIRNRLIMAVVVGSLIVVGLMVFSPPQTPPLPPLPSPNGYDDFMKAHTLLAANTDFSVMSHDQLRAMVTQNTESLRLVRVGLTRECRVPLGYSQEDMSKHMSGLASIKALAQALTAEGRLAELEHRTNDAARAYLDAMRLGHEATRGGLLIDGLVGTACEAIGRQSLQPCITNLQAAECRAIIGELEAMEKKQESFAEKMKTEKVWRRLTFPFYQRLVFGFMRIFNGGAIKRDEQKMEQKIQAQKDRRNHLLLNLATRTYELEKGHRPQTVSDLVPDFLKVIPKDSLVATNGLVKP